MRIFDRFLVFVLVVVIALIGVGFIAVCFEPFLMSNAVNELMNTLVAWRWLCLPIGAVLIVLAIILLFASVLHRKKSGKNAAVGSKAGDVQVSVGAIDVMVTQVLKQYEAVHSYTTNIHQESGGVVVQVSVIVASYANIPQLSAQLQNAVREQLEQMAGLKIKNVQILVKDVVMAEAPVVEEIPVSEPVVENEVVNDTVNEVPEQAPETE